MSSKQQIFGQRFRDFLISNKVEEFMSSGMNFPYDESNEKAMAEKKSIAIGLIFWQFLRNHVNGFFSGQPERRAIIADFLENDHLSKSSPHIRIVAMIECLPDKVWRRLLWRENIDFSSFESCLRRLSKEQTEAITNNYHDLFSLKTTPRVFKKSWRDRLKIVFRAISVKKLLREEYSLARRNQSKGAWAFNLLSLDFGFSLYPKGDNDDTRISNQKFTRFLSIKEHINDFIVNQEDGKYWFFYRTARSNYAFYPNREVKLKNHICPGFWATLIMHLLFWIVSPIGLVLTGLVVASRGFYWESLIPAVLALPMIFWTLIVLIRLILKPVKSNVKIVRVVAICILVPCLVALLLVFVGVILVAIGLVIAWLSPIFGPALSTMFALTAAFYVGFFLSSIKESSFSSYMEIPKFIRYLLHFSVAAFALALFDKFAAKPVLAFIVDTAQSFWGWYTDNLLLSNWFILSLVFSGFFAYFVNIFLTNEKLFAKFEKIFRVFTKGFLILSAIVFALLFYQVGGVYFSVFGVLPSILFILIIFIFAASIFMMDKINQKNIEKREKAESFVLKTSESLRLSIRRKLIDLIMNSRWLAQMDELSCWRAVGKIYDVTDLFFPPQKRGNDKVRISLISLLATKGSLDIISQLEGAKDKIEDFTGDRNYKLQILQSMVNGLSVEKAIETLKASLNAVERAEERIRRFGRWIAWPFKQLYYSVVWVIRKISQFFLTLKDVWSLFNERCPFVTKPKLLE